MYDLSTSAKNMRLVPDNDELKLTIIFFISLNCCSFLRCDISLLVRGCFGCDWVVNPCGSMYRLLR